MEKEVEGKGVKLKFEIDSEYEKHRAETLFTKEPETISWIKELFKEGDIFYDIGANIGVFSLFAGMLFKNQIQIYAFEPAYYNFSKLCKNINLNNLESFCNVFPIALDKETKFQTLKLASTISGAASHAMETSPDFVLEEFQSEFDQGVFSTSLDVLVDKFNFPIPTHIKIDTDGLEEQIIDGSKQTLHNPSLESVLVEITDKNEVKARIDTQMKEAGFDTSHPINKQENHSRVRRENKGTGYIKNVIYTRNQ